jgi:hypothetical protein
LRVSAYTNSGEFSVPQPDMVAWDAVDPSSSVLIVRDHTSAIVATMRGRVIAKSAALANLSGIDVRKYGVPMPALYLDRAATRNDSGSRGLNTLLRYHFIRLARDAGLKALFGLVPTGAARTGLMQRIGYTFLELPNARFDHLFLGGRTPTVAILPNSRFDMAMRRLESDLEDVLGRFPTESPQTSAGARAWIRL